MSSDGVSSLVPSTPESRFYVVSASSENVCQTLSSSTGEPAGLSAALFASKNGLETTVFDTDKTWLHKAHLFNYLGIRSMD